MDAAEPCAFPQVAASRRDAGAGTQYAGAFPVTGTSLAPSKPVEPAARHEGGLEMGIRSYFYRLDFVLQYRATKLNR